jgi:hypothetical protein
MASDREWVVNETLGLDRFSIACTEASETIKLGPYRISIKIGLHWMIMWQFDPQTTGLLTHHKPTGATSCGQALHTRTYMSWVSLSPVHMLLLASPLSGDARPIIRRSPARPFAVLPHHRLGVLPLGSP